VELDLLVEACGVVEVDVLSLGVRRFRLDLPFGEATFSPSSVVLASSDPPPRTVEIASTILYEESCCRCSRGDAVVIESKSPWRPRISEGTIRVTMVPPPPPPPLSAALVVTASQETRHIAAAFAAAADTDVSAAARNNAVDLPIVVDGFNCCSVCRMFGMDAIDSGKWFRMLPRGVEEFECKKCFFLFFGKICFFPKLHLTSRLSHSLETCINFHGTMPRPFVVVCFLYCVRLDNHVQSFMIRKPFIRQFYYDLNFQLRPISAALDDGITNSNNTITYFHANQSFPNGTNVVATGTTAFPSIRDNNSNNIVTGITLKVALDQNGGVACRHEVRPKRFTSTESLDMVHRLRAVSDAVLIGVGTAIADNPSLLVRRRGGSNSSRPLVQQQQQQPLRVILDPTLRLITSSKYHTYQLLSDGYPVVIYHSCKHINDEIRHIVDSLSSSVQLIYLPASGGSNDDDDEYNRLQQMSVIEISNHLKYHFHVHHLMVEGGPITAHLFLRAKLIDRCIVVHAPITFPDPILANITNDVLESSKLKLLGSIPSGHDLMECYSRPDIPWPSSDLQDWP
jgi:riboflavin biosynthesis pyrimidine reductase